MTETVIGILILYSETITFPSVQRIPSAIKFWVCFSKSSTVNPPISHKGIIFLDHIFNPPRFLIFVGRVDVFNFGALIDFSPSGISDAICVFLKNKNWVIMWAIAELFNLGFRPFKQIIQVNHEHLDHKIWQKFRFLYTLLNQEGLGLLFVM